VQVSPVFQEKYIDKNLRFYQNKGGHSMKMNKRGITLIELLVVFVIIAIGAALTVPAMGPWIANYRLRSAVGDLVSTLRTAQMKAVSTNLEYRVYFKSEKFWLERGNKNFNSDNWGTVGAKEGADSLFPKGVTISFTSNYVEFNTDSTCAPGASITLTNAKGTTRKITFVTSTGKVNVSP
jgi:prepilin-type N-terminal cleavage/methylation domain-containing protein